MDPFEENPAPQPTPPQSTSQPPKRKRVSGTRKVTYSAVAAAIGTLCAAVAVYLPVRLMPLVVAAFCFYIVFDRCGVVWGLITQAAVVLMTFFVGGVALSATFILLTVVFVPYTWGAYLLRRFSYAAWKGALVRGGTVAVTVDLLFLAVFYILRFSAFGGGFDLVTLSQNVGGFWVVALVLAPIAVSIDFLLTQGVRLADKLLK